MGRRRQGRDPTASAAATKPAPEPAQKPAAAKAARKSDDTSKKKGPNKKARKKKKKKKKEKLLGKPWEFRTVERPAAEEAPRRIPPPREPAIPYVPSEANPPSVIERTVVLQSDDEHLSELGGPGVVVHIGDDSTGQFELYGGTVPVVSNLPRTISFAEGENGRLILQLSTRVHDCVTTFGGSPSWSWREEEVVPDSAVDVVVAINAALDLRTSITDQYGIAVNLPELMFPSAEELIRARDDCDAMIGHFDRVMDQYHLLTIADVVLQRCVANYLKIAEMDFKAKQVSARSWALWAMSRMIA